VISRENKQMPVPDQPSDFQIRIRGHLDCKWSAWFDGMVITLEKDGGTLLTGPVSDQAALHGLLKKIRDLGMTLVSVNPVFPDQADALDNRKIPISKEERSARKNNK